MLLDLAIETEGVLF
uniref:Uncharacterized protein n=1 Tax=Rhizophora mucronata TaxID=61149 RepID=A0A2P2KUH3_RHIMU